MLRQAASTQRNGNDAPKSGSNAAHGSRSAPADGAAISRMQGKVAIAFSIALVCVGAVAGLEYRTVRRLSLDNSLAQHNESLLRELDTVRRSLSRADASVQSFVATGQNSDFESFTQASNNLKRQLKDLAELTANSPTQESKVKQLEALADECLQTMQSESEERRRGRISLPMLLPLESSLHKSRSGVQAVASDMEGEQFRIVREWSDQAEAANQETRLLVWLGGLIGCVLLACAGIGLHMDLAERGKAEASRAVAYEALRQTNERLEVEIQERAEAQRNLQGSERRMRDLSLRLLKMQDEEHRRIGRELHDSLGQYLAALKMGLDGTRNALAANLSTLRALDKLEECGELLDLSIREVRTMSYLLHPPLLEECGLKSAIPSYVEGFSRRSGIRVTLEIAPNFARLGDDAELALFRVLQEGLTNVHRHSGSSTARVRAELRDGVALLEIADDGKGMPGEARSELPCNAGVGLRGMTERMRQLGGELRMESSARGTTVRATIPQAVAEQARAASS